MALPRFSVSRIILPSVEAAVPSHCPFSWGEEFLFGGLPPVGAPHLQLLVMENLGRWEAGEKGGMGAKEVKL